MIITWKDPICFRLCFRSIYNMFTGIWNRRLCFFLDYMLFPVLVHSFFDMMAIDYVSSLSSRPHVPVQYFVCSLTFAIYACASFLAFMLHSVLVCKSATALITGHVCLISLLPFISIQSIACSSAS